MATRTTSNARPLGPSVLDWPLWSFVCTLIAVGFLLGYFTAIVIRP
jgi:hypothetical protein